MELALVPLSAHGSFYEGDCYVILSVSTTPLPPSTPLTPTCFSLEPGSAERPDDATQIPGVDLDSSSMLYRTGLQFDLKGRS